MKNQLNNYYRQIYRFLPYPRKQKQQLIESIQIHIADFLAENPAADFSSVQQHFGTPQQVAAACIDEMTTQEIISKIKTRKTVIRVLCITAAIIAVIWVSAVTIATRNAINSSNGYYETQGIIINDKEESK